MTVVPVPVRGTHVERPRPAMPDELIVALHAFRGAPFLTEQELAATWTRATLERRDEDFEVVALAVLAWGSLLRRRGEQPFARDGLLDRIGADSATLFGYVLREGRTDTFADLAEFFAQRGAPLPPLVPGEQPPAIWQLVVQVVEGYRALWLDPRIRLNGTVDAFECVALAAHALCAPDDVWPELDVATDPTGRDGAEVGRHPRFLDPIPLIIAMADVQFDEHERITGLRTAMHDLRAADKLIRSDLAAGRLGAEARRRLDAAHVDTGYYRRLMDHQQQYERGGMWTRMAHGSVHDELSREGHQVAERWSQVVAASGEAVREAEAERDRTIARYAAAAARFCPDRPDNPFRELLRERAYVGPERTAEVIARGVDGSGRVYTRMWDIEPLPDRSDVAVPYVDTNCWNAIFVPDGSDLTYDQACEAVRTIVVERLSTAKPRSVTFTWIDPVRHGQSAGSLLELLEIEKELLGRKVWSEPEEIDTALRLVTDRIATLRQSCLRDTYADLDEYNAAAGQLAEPYHVVVVTGFPHGFSQEAVGRIEQILASQSEVGISLLLVTEPKAGAGVTRQPGPAGYLDVLFRDTGSEGDVWPKWTTFLSHRLVVGHAGSAWATLPTSPSRPPVFARCSWEPFDDRAARAIVAGYGKASKDALNVTIDSHELVARETGTQSSAVSLDVPLGLRGRGSDVSLALGQGLQQNVLVGGLPGSGKSSLFHTMIANAVRRYPPEELELYLLDFKQGVEFQPYAARALPHARVVAVESEREFGLSVLRGLRAEIGRRAELFRGEAGAGSDSLREYRDRTGQPMPRILVVIDEFQVIFADDDAVAHECASLLDQVVRQGRAFGIHTVLGTQTLRGQGTLGLIRGTLDQVAVRIVLKSSEADARLFLGDDNPAGARLSRPGQAIFNPDGGSPASNVEFQVALTSDETRDAAIDEARRTADARGFRRRPVVFDGTRRVDIREDPHVHALATARAPRDPRVLRLHLGLSAIIGGSGGVELRRDAAAHVLIVERDLRVAGGALASALVSALLSAPTPPRIVAVDGVGIDEDEGELLPRVLQQLPDAACLRRRKLGRALSDLVAEVRRRLAEDDYAAPRVLLVLQAVHRLRELSDEFSPDGSPQQDLVEILRDGSDVGVHVIATVDAAENLERRLGHAALAEFGARLVGQCSADASHRVVGSAAASRLRAGSMVLHQPDLDRTEKVRPFPVPDPGWVAQVLGQAR